MGLAFVLTNDDALYCSRKSLAEDDIELSFMMKAWNNFARIEVAFHV
jgi:hypothetical protein